MLRGQISGWKMLIQGRGGPRKKVLSEYLRESGENLLFQGKSREKLSLLNRVCLDFSEGGSKGGGGGSPLKLISYYKPSQKKRQRIISCGFKGVMRVMASLGKPGGKELEGGAPSKNQNSRPGREREDGFSICVKLTSEPKGDRRMEGRLEKEKRLGTEEPKRESREKIIFSERWNFLWNILEGPRSLRHEGYTGEAEIEYHQLRRWSK